MSDDDYETWAGPYVLGALSPAERDAFARHLTECSACRTAVEELAGLPGLLSRVPPTVVAELAGDEGADTAAIPPLPDTLLPRLLRQAQRRRRRLVAVAIGGLAAAVLGIVVGIGAATAPDRTSNPGTVAGSAMHGEPGLPIQATVALTSVGWGTKLDLACQYEDYSRGEVAYALVVVGKDGAVEQVGTWNALPGKLARMSAGTALAQSDISSVQVRTMRGRPVLTLDVPAATG